MLRLEWQENQTRSRSVSDIWCIDPCAREAQGYCLSYLKVKFFLCLQLVFKINSFSYFFLKIEDCQPSQFPSSEFNQYSIKLVPANRSSFPSHTFLQKGDNVVLSTNREVAVATGCLIDIGTCSLTLTTDRNVKNWDRSYEVKFYLIYFKCSIPVI